MTPARLAGAGALGVSALVALLAAAALGRLSPLPVAEMARGSEDAFASGLHRRELPPGQPPLRWTTTRATFAFRNLPPGAAILEVRVHGQRAPVSVAGDGVLLGAIDPGQAGRDFAVRVGGEGRLSVELRTDGFLAGDGRRLGVLLDRVGLVPSARTWPGVELWLALLAPALTVALGAMGCGLSAVSAGSLSVAVTCFETALLWPSGLACSRYAIFGPALVLVAAVAATLFGALTGRGEPAAMRWAFVALLGAALVQGVAATWPGMVVSDAVFHANKLAAVAGGDLFPTSMTQHARPFRIPYGVSFYALLAPLARAGLDEVALVRWGAALAAVAASALLFRLVLPAGAAIAGLAVLVLQLVPITFDVHSYGNFSNVFGQAATVAFLAWWVRRGRGGWPVGAFVFAVGALAHFSSLIVLGAWTAALVLLERRELRRNQVLALCVGAGGSIVYYLHFAGLVASQLPRLFEGDGGGGEGARIGGGVLRQLLALPRQWGIPVAVLAVAGRPRLWGSPLDRASCALWLAGAGLAMIAAVSPLEVRYLYALTAPLAIAAAAGFLDLGRRGNLGRVAAWALLGAQALLCSRDLAEALLARYRP